MTPTLSVVVKEVIGIEIKVLLEGRIVNVEMEGVADASKAPERAMSLLIPLAVIVKLAFFVPWAVNAEESSNVQLEPAASVGLRLLQG